MKTKKQVYSLAASMGVDVDDNSSSFRWDITFWHDTKDFEASDAKCLVVSWYAGSEKKGEFWQLCYEELSEGLK